tara:strand:+ start:347 stop:916 length:570 start_codon:yes stop_codon:yes gene_type:complete
MTGTSLVTLLSDRIEDNSHVRFTSSQKVNALNQAQDFLVATLPVEKLRLLETSTTKSNNSGGVVSVSEFAILRDHLVSVQNATTLEYGTVIYHDKKDVTSSYISPCYLLGSDLYYPTAWDTGEAVGIGLNVTYLSVPTDIADSSSVLPLTDIHYNIICDMAESILWNTDNKPQRAQFAEQRALAQIQTL